MPFNHVVGEVVEDCGEMVSTVVLNDGETFFAKTLNDTFVGSVLAEESVQEEACAGFGWGCDWGDDLD